MKRLIQYHMSKVRLAHSDLDYMNGIVKKILPLIDHFFPTLVGQWQQEIQKHNQCFAKNDIEVFERQERYLRILHFGCDVAYWVYMESFLFNWINCSHEHHTWIRYAYLRRLKRDLNLSRDYFRQKVLYHEEVGRKRKKQYKNKPRKIRHLRHDQRDCNLLDRYIEYIEIKSVQGTVNKIYENLIYTRSKIDASIEIILNNLFNGIEQHSLSPIFPLSIKFDLIEEGLILCVKVEWDYGLIEILKLHTFREVNYTKNIIQAFAIDLCTKGRAHIDRGKDSGASANKYLQRLGIQGPLKGLFIDIVGDEIRVKKKEEISLMALPVNEVEQLDLFLGQLEFFAWDFQRLSKSRI